MTEPRRSLLVVGCVPSDADVVLLMTEPQAGFAHTPVMLDEVVAALSGLTSGVFVDATLGAGGHAAAVLDAHPHLTLHGFDHDPAARDAAAETLGLVAARVVVHGDRFDQCADVLAAAGIDRIAGFLMDLGVSSPQLDVAERGFSYHHDGPLDMRMDPTRSRDAGTVVNTYTEPELVDVLRSYGDERHAARIARAIVTARPIASTAHLAEVIADAVPAAARRQPGHPARRSFQAIRIEVNDELSILAGSVQSLVDLLDVGGVGLVLTYHSGEDRIVKDVMRTNVEGADLPGMPRTSPFDWLFRGAHTPSAAELERNPRARSARLRGIVRTGDRS